MEIQSVIQITKYIETEKEDEFGFANKKQHGYLSASIDKVGQQCIINIQIFEKENFEEIKEEVQKQILDFFAHLNACAQNSNLEVLNLVLPADEKVEQKIMKMSL